MEVSGQRNEKTVCHRIDERRTSLDRHLLQLERVAEGALWHRLEPAWQALHGRNGWRHHAFVLGGAAEDNREAFAFRACIVAPALPYFIQYQRVMRSGGEEGIRTLATALDRIPV